MKIKIDKDGNLWLERAGKMKIQECKETILETNDFNPAVTEYIYRPCGDWCPLFDDSIGVEEDNSGTEVVSISICEGKVLQCRVEDFEDGRE